MFPFARKSTKPRRQRKLLTCRGFEVLESRMPMSASSLVPISGDWTASGQSHVGLYAPASSTFYLRYQNSSNFADSAFKFGAGGATIAPLTGDWDGNKTSTVGLYNSATGQFNLRNTNAAGAADIALSFGPTGGVELPLSGDWTGVHRDSIGVYDQATGTFYLRNTLTPGPANEVIPLGPVVPGWTGTGAGASAWKPVTGDFIGQGKDTIGLYNVTTGRVYLDNNLNHTAVDQAFTVFPGDSGSTPIVGDWNGDHIDTLGIYDSAGNFELKDQLSLAAPTNTFYVAAAQPGNTLAPGALQPLLGPPPVLTPSDVQTLLARAAAASTTTNAIIAVVDREGNILGVRVEQNVLTTFNKLPQPQRDQTLVFAIDGAVAEARTGAFFANNQAPLTSRTVRFISQSTVTQREAESSPEVTDPNSPQQGPGLVAPIGLGGNFPPGVMNTPSADLFGIEQTNRDHS